MSKTRWLVGALAFLLLGAVATAQVGGPGLFQTTLYAGRTLDAGQVSVWNSPKKLMVQVNPSGNWQLREVHIWYGYPELGQEIPATKKGNPIPGKFPYKKEFDELVPKHTATIDLVEDLGFSWGSQAEDRRVVSFAVHASLVLCDTEDDSDGGSDSDSDGCEVRARRGAWAWGPQEFSGRSWGWIFEYLLAHPMRGQFIDSPVQGLGYHGPTQHGVTGYDEDGYPDDQGGFAYFPGEGIDFAIGTVPLRGAQAAKKVSPLDFFAGADTEDPRVLDVAQILQTLDEDSGADQRDGKIVILPEVAECFDDVVRNGNGGFGYLDATGALDFGLTLAIDTLLEETVYECDGVAGAELAAVSVADAQGNLEAGLNASGIFRKNISKTEDWAETKQKLDVMPVYFPAKRSDGSPSTCCLDDKSTEEDECADTTLWEPGVGYFEWRLGGDPDAEECDPRDWEDGSCVTTLIECREVAKPLVVTYMEKIDISDANTDFNECGPEPTHGCRFSYDIVTAVSRDDGNTWKRMNVSRMADLSSFDLETGEPFPGTVGSPYLKVNDNYILNVWQSKFCKSGNPRYSINVCPDEDGDGTPDDCLICRGNPDEGTEVCEPDYPGDDPYYVTDIWGVRGKQRSVNYDEVDDVADLGIGEIPFSCLWAARGVIVTQKDLDQGVFASLIVEDDPTTEEDEAKTVELGDIIWYKPERLTSGRRDAYIPAAASARGAGFAIAWQEDPTGLRPGKGKGPGQGWSGAISNHKTDIWYSYLSFEDFADVDADFVPGGPGDDPNGEASYDERPGLGRPKALVPFSLPVRISDNDMVNSHTLKVEPSTTCVTPPDGTDPVCFPEIDPVTGTYVPLNSDEIASEFCGHPDADPATCCDPDNHEGDPNCEDLKGLYGNLSGTKRYAYLARAIDDDGDGVSDYQYFEDRGGTLDLCDLSGLNSVMEELPGDPGAHERWFTFANVEGSSKLVCVTSDGRLLDGDVSASRPNMQMQPYTKPDGTKSAWVLLGYEESKGMGHSLAAEAHDATDNPVDEIINEDKGQEKPIKQDLGKNVIYHSFDFTQPDLVSAGHIVNLPALCGGLYPTYCGEDYVGDNPTCTCTPGQPVPLYFDYQECSDPADPTTCEWMPDETKFLQYRTEIARRVRFIMQSGSKAKPTATGTLGAIIYKQGQEGQGRPADVFIRRMVLPEGINYKTDNPFAFENFECSRYLDESDSPFATLQACPNGAGDKPSATGYMCNVWGEAYGDRLCGGFNSAYGRRDHINLTSADIDLAVDAGPDDDTPDDPTDDIYGTEKVLLWSQHDYNLGDESYGVEDTSTCDLASCAGMYSNARSHRGFIRGDFLVTAYAWSPNWAAGRNGNDRYNFYTRRSFDGGQTWTTTPATLGGSGVYQCPEWRSDPTVPDDDGSGNAPPSGVDPECVDYCAPDDLECVPTGDFFAAGAFEPARKVSQFDNNKETSSDPRVGATPPVRPIDGRDGTLPILSFVEDEYVDNVFFVAWGGGDNAKSTGGTAITPEAPPTDLWYTRSEDWGDHYLKVPWVIGGTNSNQGVGETVWRYDFLAKGAEEEQGECQLRATSDGSKVYAIYHQMIPEADDPDAELTRWYPWEPEVSYENDLWFRRVVFWPEGLEPPPAPVDGGTTSSDSATGDEEPADGPTFDEGLGGVWDGATPDPVDPAEPVAEVEPATPVAEAPVVSDTPEVETDAQPVPEAAVPSVPDVEIGEPPRSESPIEPPVVEPMPASEVTVAETEVPAEAEPGRLVQLLPGSVRSPAAASAGSAPAAGERKVEGEDAEGTCDMYGVFELTPDSLKMRAVYHHELPEGLDPYEPVTSWHEWEKQPESSLPDVLWVRQWILCDEAVTETPSEVLEAILERESSAS